MCVKDTCRLDSIYNDQFQYFLPKAELTNYLEGYTEEEQLLVKEDIVELAHKIIGKSWPGSGKLAVISVGDPGSGTTTLMMKNLCQSGRNFAYVDTDELCLKGLKRR